VRTSTPQAARITGCSVSQLDHWRRSGLLAPSAGPEGPAYEFRDLVAARMIRSLLDSGLSLTRIHRALGYLTESGDDYVGLRILTDGTHVWACHDDGQILDALRRGQMVLFLAVDRFAEEIQAEVRRFESERREFLVTMGASPPAHAAR
jgi:DNA-binding transcriptional MerR regulator